MKTAPHTCNLRQIHLDRGWSIEELARKSGITRKSISHAERGNDPRLSTMIMLSRACGCELHDIWPDAKVTKVFLNGAGEAHRLSLFARRSIVRDRKDGLRLWKIAEKLNVSIDAVKIVLMEKGEKLVKLNNPRELRRPTTRPSRTTVKVRQPRINNRRECYEYIPVAPAIVSE